MADLPDYYTQAQISEAEAAKFKGGLEANLPAAPVSRDIYLATDKQILYVCIADGVWTGFDAATLTQGILTLYANLVAGGYRLTGLGAPTAQDDALRYNRAEIRNAEIAAGAAIVYSKLNLTGAIKKGDIKAAAGIEYSKLALAASIVMADFAAAIKNAANGIVVLDASADVPEAQIPEHMSKNKLAFTANKVLLGAGAGANPTEIDPGIDWSVKTPVVDEETQSVGTLAAETYYDVISVTAAGYLTNVKWLFNAGDTAPDSDVRETLQIDGGEIFSSHVRISDDDYRTSYDGTNVIFIIAFTLLHRFATSFKIGCFNKHADTGKQQGVRLDSCAYVLD